MAAEVRVVCEVAQVAADQKKAVEAAAVEQTAEATTVQADEGEAMSTG